MKNNKTALVTGASSGIGLEFAKILAKNGYNLVIVSQNSDKLDQARSELSKIDNANVIAIVKDLSKDHSADEVFQIVNNQRIVIDALINNAGFGDHGRFSETNWEKENSMIHLNIIALTRLTKLFLPQMIENKNGKIVNVASTAAFQAGPFMSVYYATKAYVLYFSEAIANELKGSGVSVTTLCPGGTKSGFQDTSNVNGIRFIKNSKLATTKEVAKYGYESMLKGKAVAIHGFKNKVMAFLVRFVSRKYATNMAGKLMKKQ